MQKGVSADEISEIIESRTDEDEYNLCMEQARKYLKSKTVSDLKDVQKFQACLARKGFDFDTIKKVSREVLKTDE